MATPIGNLEDISARAISVLTKVSLIACENLSRTKRLFSLLGIDDANKRFISLSDAREQTGTRKVLEALKHGLNVAVLSDAGTPLVADPGYELIRAAYAEHIHVTTIPGPSSLTAVLSLCPIPMNRFRFVGFLSSKSNLRKNELMEVSRSVEPSVFFEAPHRVISTLETLVELGLSERSIFIARELTKKFEEVRYCCVADALQSMSALESVRGEFVLVLAPSDAKPRIKDADLLIEKLLPHMKITTLAKVVSDVSALTREEAYACALELKGSNE